MGENLRGRAPGARAENIYSFRPKQSFRLSHGMGAFGTSPSPHLKDKIPNGQDLSLSDKVIGID